MIGGPIGPAVARRAAVSAVLLCALAALAPGAEAADPIVAVLSSEAAPYREAYRAFQEGLGQRRQSVQIHELVLKDGASRGTPEKLAAAERGRAEVLDDIARRRPALVLTVGSPATTLVQSDVVPAGLRSTPIVFCMVLNPQAAGLVQSMQSSGNNLTGASLDIPVKVQFETLQSVVPKVKRIGVFYNPAETEKVVQPAARVAAEMGLELVGIAVTSPEQLPEFATTLRTRRLDALWSVADSTVFASSRSLEFLVRRAVEARIPFMGLSPDFVKSGALLALSVDYRDIGLQCGEQAAHVLRGSPPSSVPITIPRKVTLHINPSTARGIGLEVPSAILDKAVVYTRYAPQIQF